MSCEHNDFHTDAKVYKLQDKENGPVVGFQLNVKVKCKSCNTEFAFVGVPNGNFNQKFATASPEFTELHQPIAPVNIKPKSKIFSIN